MKVKDLIKELKKLNPEAIAVTSDYNGCNHAVDELSMIVQHQTGETVTYWDNSSYTSVIDHKTGKCKVPVVYLK